MKDHTVPKPMIRKPRPEIPPTRQEMTLILNRAHELSHGEDVTDILTLIAHTGLRVKELRELMWEQVDTKNGFLTVRSENTCHTRRVPIAPEVSQILEKHRAQMSDSVYVLGDRRASMVRYAMTAMAKISQRYCGRRLGLHSLRNAFAISQFESGSNLFSACEIMGYSHRADSLGFKAF